MFKYSLLELLNAYKDNTHLIEAYIKNQSIEGFKGDSNDDDNDGKNATILGMGIAIFLVLLMISLAIFITALYLLIKDWDYLPDWAKILGVLGLVLFIGPIGPIMTIVIVLVGKDQRR